MALPVSLFLDTLARCSRNQLSSAVTNGRLRSVRTPTRCCGAKPLISRSIANSTSMRVDDAFARQMPRQGPPSRPAPFERRHRHLLARRRGCYLSRRVRLRGIRLQIGELKLKLIEQRTTFRGLAEPIVSKLPDRELELLDQQRPVLGLALRRGRPLLRRTQCLTLRDDERMRARKVGWKRIIKAHWQ